jgi:hypothetical protein
MNLVAKEYVAARVDLGGALVLSEFAGAAGELRQAFLCNPHDLQGVKDALMRAVKVDSADAARRMRTMRRHLRAHDVKHWASAFLSALGAPGAGPGESVAAVERAVGSLSRPGDGGLGTGYSGEGYPGAGNYPHGGLDGGGGAAAGMKRSSEA